ncbi:MAG: N-acetylmuramoyl-L-alanine amidase [Chloroflexi bacterium]|nr:N-acetylmuramoyl-L-alanine amidase [Chloroflexota bacterium]MBP8056605.1 N-acetylmuramoyl-L-alanine amidase [Chloroflexota bacterium]
MTKLRIFLLLLFVFVVAADGSSPVQASGIFAADMVFAGLDFATGEMEQMVVTTEGLTPSAAAATATYISPIFTAPRPFNALVPQWVATLPSDTAIQMRLRTANAAGVWNEWYDIVPNEDWMVPEDTDTVGNMVVAPEVDGTHSYFQYTVTFSRRITAAAPFLHQIRFTFIDATAGPTSAELAALAQTEPQTPEDGYPKPPVVSRDVWCTDPACDYTTGLEYYPVSHLIIHHTVSANTSTNWAAVVRAIWYFHTFTRGWGDIGYNYLVDMNGILYEGHNGGDDVVGTHSSGANAGSMALSFIGTFTLPTQDPPGIPPPQAMLDSAIELLAWKADQKEIDVYDSSQLPNMDWGLPHLMGHRDAYGTTACPGEQAHDLIPWIRDMVAAAIGFTPPHTYIDEQTPAFTRSNSTWTDGPNSCGYNVHAWYARSTTGTATHWGRWQLPVTQSGYYIVEVYAPYCNTGFSDTHGATYEVHHTGGSTPVTVDQGNNLGLWVSLGEFYFASGEDNYIYLNNQTTTDSNLGMWFDAIRMRPQVTPAPTVNLQFPPPDTWLNNPQVYFGWEVTNTANIQSQTLELATDPVFTDLLFTGTFSATITSHIVTFSQDYHDLYWRVRVNPIVGPAITSNTGHLGLDSVAPTSGITGIYVITPTQLITSTQHQVFWGGNDAISGITSYTIEYQAEGDNTWTPWYTSTLSTNGMFVAPVPGTVYWFRAQAIDAASNLEPAHASGDMSTAQAILLDNQVMLPIIQR